MLNCDGSSGAMESDGLLLLFNEMQAKVGGKIYYDTVVTDDDKELNKYMTRPGKRMEKSGWGLTKRNHRTKIVC